MKPFGNGSDAGPKGVEGFVRSGDPAEEILQRAAAVRVNLIATSTHGGTGVRRVLFGSVAQAVLSKSFLPILLAPADAR